MFCACVGVTIMSQRVIINYIVIINQSDDYFRHAAIHAAAYSLNHSIKVLQNMQLVLKKNKYKIPRENILRVFAYYITFSLFGEKKTIATYTSTVTIPVIQT